MSAMAADGPEMASERWTHVGTATMENGELERRLRRAEGVAGCAASRAATSAATDVAREPLGGPEHARARHGESRRQR